MPDDQLQLAKERTSLADERTRSANERTFSAWVRTGLACVGGGAAIVRLLNFVEPTHKILATFTGILLMVLGMVIFILSFIDYKQGTKKTLSQSGFAGSVASTTFIFLMLILISSLMMFIALS